MAPGMPLHPEFVYRRTGHWCGWSDFLGSPGDDSERDAIEDQAWAIYQHRCLVLRQVRAAQNNGAPNGAPDGTGGLYDALSGIFHWVANRAA